MGSRAYEHCHGVAVPRRKSADRYLETLPRVEPASGLPPTCIVKTAAGVRYKNVVSTVDAITLAGIPHYSVQDSLVEGERALLAHRGAP